MRHLSPKAGRHGAGCVGGQAGVVWGCLFCWHMEAGRQGYREGRPPWVLGGSGEDGLAMAGKGFSVAAVGLFYRKALMIGEGWDGAPGPRAAPGWQDFPGTGPCTRSSAVRCIGKRCVRACLPEREFGFCRSPKVGRLADQGRQETLGLSRAQTTCVLGRRQSLPPNPKGMANLPRAVGSAERAGLTPTRWRASPCAPLPHPSWSTWPPLPLAGQ